jgi:pyruvate kinase
MRTKIIFTCGPACDEISILKRMAHLAAGFRLNTAHLTRTGLEVWLEKLLRLRNETGKNFTIILDLQGAKVRIGKFPQCRQLPEKVELFWGKESDNCNRIPVPDQTIFNQTEPGHTLFLNDRKVIVEVVEKDSIGKNLKAEVLQNGPLSSYKGLNSARKVFHAARVTDSDQAAIELSLGIKNLSYAISFVSDGREADLFADLVKDHSLIAKIEQVVCFDYFDKIFEKFSQIWLCRGDLGTEAGLLNLGKYQELFCKAIHNKSVDAVIAGEVLGSMVKMPYPSRAEIVQLYDAINSGFSGIVLSDETACGENPEKVLDFCDFYFNG